MGRIELEIAAGGPGGGRTPRASAAVLQFDRLVLRAAARPVTELPRGSFVPVRGGPLRALPAARAHKWHTCRAPGFSGRRARTLAGATLGGTGHLPLRLRATTKGGQIEY